MVCLMCHHFEVTLILRRPRRPIGVMYSQQKKYAHMHVFQSIDPPTHAWQANRQLQTYQENVTPSQHIALFHNKNHNTESASFCNLLQKVPS